MNPEYLCDQITRPSSIHTISHSINNNKRRHHKKVTYTIKNEKFKIWDYYVPIRVLGTGSYAVVIEAKDTRFNGRHVAIKKNRNVFANLSDAKRIFREISLLMTFSHDDIIALTGVIPPDEENQSTFDDVYLIMPRMETTLHHVIKSNQELTDKHCLFFIYQILRGLKYIHSAGIAHRDIKPENLLVNCRNCNIKIIDFGLATFTIGNNNLTEYVVTRWYRAPEVMLCAKQYGVQVDMWSVGCIFGELIIRDAIFPGQNHFEQLSLIFSILGTPEKHELEWITSTDAKNYVLNLPHQKGHDLRKIFKTCAAEEIDLIKSMLEINPKKRINVNQALSHPYFFKLHHKKTETIIDKNEFDKQIAQFNIIENKYNSLFGIRHLMYQTLVNFDPYLKKIKVKQSRLVQTERALNHKKEHSLCKQPPYKLPDSC